MINCAGRGLNFVYSFSLGGGLHVNNLFDLATPTKSTSKTILRAYLLSLVTSGKSQLMYTCYVPIAIAMKNWQKEKSHVGLFEPRARGGRIEEIDHILN